ncbi:MAG: polyprenyl synthetase family protein [Candidatus Kapaibacteriales bacterium]
MLENLKQISQPVESHLKDFDPYYKGVLKTDVTLLNLILRYMAKSKGKQIRPILVFLSAGACGDISDRTYIGASMVELLHTATLVHDDVVDRAESRRGIASINAEWGNKIAVLAGDFLLSKGLSVAADNNEFDFLKFTSTAVRRMAEGELLGLDKGRKMDLEEETYFKIIAAKTASLISTCCKIGARSASDNEETVGKLGEYGENLGIAFQLRDDIFDYTSRSSIIGKPIANDIKEKKVTLPLIYSFKNGDQAEAKRIRSLIKKGNLSDKSVEEALAFVSESGGVDYTKQTALRYRDKAKEALYSLPDSEFKNALNELADFVLTRKN